MSFLLLAAYAVIMKRPTAANVKNRRSWEEACENLKMVPRLRPEQTRCSPRVRLAATRPGPRFRSIEFLSPRGRELPHRRKVRFQACCGCVNDVLQRCERAAQPRPVSRLHDAINSGSYVAARYSSMPLVDRVVVKGAEQA